MTPTFYDLNSPAGLRAIVTALFCGYNYRLYTRQVRLIQIRINRPQSELYDFFKDKAEKQLAEPPSSAEDIQALVRGMPDSLFTPSN